MNPRKALTVMEELRSPGDVVYEVFKRRKSTVFSQFMDTMLELIPSLVDTFKNNQAYYLVASDNSGKIVEIDNDVIRDVLEVPNWTSAQKDGFKKVIIGDYEYKKYRKIS